MQNVPKLVRSSQENALFRDGTGTIYPQWAKSFFFEKKWVAKTFEIKLGGRDCFREKMGVKTFFQKKGAKTF